ncbi:tRNA (adenosine(37)-N6)-dimethylallyltransferase MiaA [Chloroflexota bacterium]
MSQLIAVVGPTGIGKSRLGLHLAKTFNGEIVSADSRQVYRHMSIGTAKPGTEELSLVHHHLIDTVNPGEDFSLAKYQSLAYQAIRDIERCHKLPVFVGGSGLYVWAVLEGWKIPEVPPDLEFRHNLEKMAAISGPEALYQELLKVDPMAAQKIDRRNIRRVIRALEVHGKTSKPFSQLQEREAPPFDAFIIGLTAERAELYHRIDQRIDRMIERGLVKEVDKLVNMGYDFNLAAMSSIGYKQIGLFLKGELPLATAIQQIKTETHRFVRHQYAWFRLKDDRIRWFDVQKQTDCQIETAITEFIKG